MQVAETLQKQYQDDLIRLRNLIVHIIESSNEPLNLSRINRILSTTYKIKMNGPRMAGFLDGLYLNGDISLLKIDGSTTIVSTPKKLGIYDTSIVKEKPIPTEETNYTTTPTYRKYINGITTKFNKAKRNALK